MTSCNEQPSPAPSSIAYSDPQVTVHHGDCLDVLAEMPDNSIDAIVTDPPYGLGFMGKAWDDLPPGLPWAQECLRVLKPGGHLLAFGGTRTWHRLAVAVEDAGFEMRDSIAWLYGSGFPKSLDVSKAIDKVRNDRDDILAVTSAMADAAQARGISRADVDAHMGTSDMGGWWLSRLRHRCQCPKWDQWLQLKEFLGLDDTHDAEVRRLNGRKGTPGEAWEQREVIGERTTGIGTGRGSVAYIADSDNRDVTAPATPAAQQWAGWGTALKPAFEPIVVARKPLVGTVAANVQQFGTGALNIDATRVQHGDNLSRYERSATSGFKTGGVYGDGAPALTPASPAGRWPTNVVLDGDMANELDAEVGPLKSAKTTYAVDYGARVDTGSNAVLGRGLSSSTPNRPPYLDQGGPSRFFPVFKYQAKAPTRERPSYVKDDGTKAAHNTVKPLALMRWLVRLVTPPGGTVLDMFAGSGTTVEAASLEGLRCIAIEREADYLPLIMQRIRRCAEGLEGQL